MKLTELRTLLRTEPEPEVKPEEPAPPMYGYPIKVKASKSITSFNVTEASFVAADVGLDPATGKPTTSVILWKNGKIVGEVP